ncbi:MAG: substrate-binding domain-containing protein, partial [Armatimonadetes bacterium]|nr:substrate-binding domain-containing protein [Armatimonadota bacterium]
MRAGTILGLTGLLALAGCGSGDSGGQGEGSYRIAVIPKGTAHEFWKTVAAGARQAGDDLGVEVIWKGPLKEDERSEQIKVVNDFIIQEVDGICLAPLDSKGLRKPVADAAKAKIPVVIFDSGIEDSDVVSFVATDNYVGGETAGQHMAKLLGGGGKVIVLRYMEGSSSTHQREEGFIAAVEA